jgi:hypothetical protein
MPSHYDKPLPKRKPPAPIRGDAPTRGMNPAEIEAALEAGEITQKEAAGLLKNFQRMQEFVRGLDEKVDARVKEVKKESPADLQKFVQGLDKRVEDLQKKTKNKQGW